MVFPTSVVCVTHAAFKSAKKERIPGGMKFIIYLSIYKEPRKQFHSQENFLHASGWSVKKRENVIVTNKVQYKT